MPKFKVEAIFTAKSNRGGKRKGAGHPCDDEGVNRIPLSLTIHPDSLSKIDDNVKAQGFTSRGKYIDYVMSAQ